MKLREFLNYRTHCPLCGNKLYVSCLGRRHKINIEDGRVNITTKISGRGVINKSFKVTYSLNFADNDFIVEFSDMNDKMYDEYVPLDLIIKFKKFHQNLPFMRFMLLCPYEYYDCSHYSYVSTNLVFSFTHSTYTIAMPKIEKFWMLVGENGFVLTSYFDEDTSEIKVLQHNIIIKDIIKVPLLPFVSEQATLERIKRLMVFS